MSKREKQFEKGQIVDCTACNGSISLGFYMGRGDVICCEECGTEYLLKSRKPLRLIHMEDEDDEDGLYYLDEEEDDYGTMVKGSDDGYGDGRGYN